MKLNHLSNHQLHQQTIVAAQTEQRATLELLKYLREVEARKLFAVRGYSSLFEYIVKALHYSEAAASERVAAMRLLKELPEAEAQMASGALTLTTAAKIHHFIKAEEKIAGKRIELENKQSLLAESMGKSKRELEQLLLTKTNNLQAAVVAERVRPLTLEHSQVTLVVRNELIGKIEKIKQLTGIPALSHTDVLQAALDHYAQHLEKQKYGGSQRNASQPAVLRELSKEHSRYIPKSVRRAVSERSHGCCEFVDSVTGRRCEARVGLQFEHRQPYALGGQATLENIAHYCFQHNQLQARRKFPEIFTAFHR